MRFSVKSILVGLVLVVVATPVFALDTIWDTGAPHPVIFNDALTYLGYSSGNLSSSMPQRWAAIPFRVESPSAIINEIHADWFDGTSVLVSKVKVIIWNREALLAPDSFFDVFLELSLDAAPGIDDPRVDGTDNYLHIQTVNFTIPQGDYYFTIASELGDGSNLAWLTGGDLQAEDLEENHFMWRSATFPSPGFVAYSPGSIQAPEGMDPDDRWNPSFALKGTAVPEPGSLAALACGLAGAFAMIRKRK